MAKKKQPTSKAFALPVERIEKSILLIRDEKVMLDADLAELYDVSTGRLNEQVKRNADRFPDDSRTILPSSLLKRSSIL